MAIRSIDKCKLTYKRYRLAICTDGYDGTATVAWGDSLVELIELGEREYMKHGHWIVDVDKNKIVWKVGIA